MLEGEAQALTRKAAELAKAGNALALKLCLDRVYAPRRDRAVSFALPPIASAEDLAAAMAAISAATAAGDLTPGEAFDLARVAESFLRVIDARNEELRRKQWAARAAQRAAARPEPSFAARMDAWIKSGKGAWPAAADRASRAPAPHPCGCRGNALGETAQDTRQRARATMHTDQHGYEQGWAVIKGVPDHWEVAGIYDDEDEAKAACARQGEGYSVRWGSYNPKTKDFVTGDPD